MRGNTVQFPWPCSGDTGATLPRQSGEVTAHPYLHSPVPREGLSSPGLKADCFTTSEGPIRLHRLIAIVT